MAAVVDFDDWARTLQGLTSDKAALKAAIDQIDNSGGTDIGAGVSLGLQELAKSTDPARAQIMILLTDGVGSYDPLLTVQAGNAGDDDLHDRARHRHGRVAAAHHRDRDRRHSTPRSTTRPTCPRSSARSPTTTATTARTPTATA